jgi:hypothetical protein
MSGYQRELDRFRRMRVRVAALVGLALAAAVGVWLTAPFGIVLLTRGESAGWLLVAAGALLAACGVVVVVAAVRSRLAPPSLPGKPNERFDEPVPSEDLRRGYSAAGTRLGSF